MRRKSRLTKKGAAPSYGDRLLTFQNLVTLLSLALAIVSIFVSFQAYENQARTNDYFLRENETAKNLISLARFDYQANKMELIPYSSDFSYLRCFVYTSFRGKVQKYFVVAPQNTITILPILQNLKELSTTIFDPASIEKNMAIVDGYPMLIESYYVYKGRSYHSVAQYGLSFEVSNLEGNGFLVKPTSILYGATLKDGTDPTKHIEDEERKMVDSLRKRFVEHPSK